MHLYALGILATATWLAGWLSVSAGIVSQEAQLMLTTGSTRLAVNQGQQT